MSIKPRLHADDGANGFSDGGEDEDERSPPDQTCCLVDDNIKCTRPAGNASYSKRIQKTVMQRHLKLHLDSSTRHIYICDFHKTVIQSARAARVRRKESEDDSNEPTAKFPELDLSLLSLNALRRYKRHFKVSTRPGLNKGQLSDILVKHFRSIPVSEKEILANFVHTVKTNGNKLDQKQALDLP